MKCSITFNLPTESDEFESAMHGAEYRTKLDEMWEQLFRGRHKHGYVSDKINKLLGMNTEGESPGEIACNELMDELEKIYQSIMQPYS